VHASSPDNLREGNGLGIRHHFSGARFYKEAGVERATILSNKWKNRAGLQQDSEAVKSIVHPKTTDMDEFTSYLHMQYGFDPDNIPSDFSFGFQGNCIKAIAEKSKQKYSRLRSYTYHKKQRVYSTIFKDIRDKATDAYDGYINIDDTLVQIHPNVTIFYGGANVRPAMKGGRRGGVPTKEFRRRCKHFFETQVVNEFMTSQICFQCDARLFKPMNKTFQENGRKNEIRGIRICKSCQTSKSKILRKHAVVNRDEVAAMNMTRRAQHHDATPFARRNDKQGTQDWTFFPGTKREKNAHEQNARRAASTELD
jgi:hypothetical protein